MLFILVFFGGTLSLAAAWVTHSVGYNRRFRPHRFTDTLPDAEKPRDGLRGFSSTDSRQ